MVETSTVTGPLQRICELSEHIDRLHRDRESAIYQALQAGATWAQVGRALGLSAQAAHKRYRWLRHSSTTGETWREPPLPIRP
jgi:hypothetical protein